MSDNITQADDPKAGEDQLTESDVLAGIMSSALQRVTHSNLFSPQAAPVHDKLRRLQESRERYLNELTRYRHNWITRGIYDILTNDVIPSDDDAGFMITIEGHPEIAEDCTNMLSDIGLIDLLPTILPEVLHYGSYPMRPVLEEGVGLIALIDDLDTREVITITDNLNQPLIHFVTNNADDDGIIDYSKRMSMEYLTDTEIVNFSLDMSFIKLKVPDKMSEMMKRKVVEATGDESSGKVFGRSLKIRSSCGFLWGVLDKLKNTLLMDKLGVYKSLANLVTPTVLGIPLPASNDITQLNETVQKYDDLINSTAVRAIDTDSMELSIQDIAAVRCIPLSGDKSTPQVLDTGRDNNDIDPEKVQASLDQLLRGIGIPPELFIGEKTELDSLKTNIRYAKNVKKIKKAVCDFVRYLIVLHIAYSVEDENLDISIKDIKVNLSSSLNLDVLENLEAQDLVTSSIGSMANLMESLVPVSKDSGYSVDSNKFMEIVRDSLAGIGSPYQAAIVITKDAVSPLVAPEEPPQ